jgi:hypothetical protein
VDGRQPDLRLEYYTKSGGDISLGFFRKKSKTSSPTPHFSRRPNFSNQST